MEVRVWAYGQCLGLGLGLNLGENMVTVSNWIRIQC